MCCGISGSISFPSHWPINQHIRSRINPPCIAPNPGPRLDNHFWKESPCIHRASPIGPQRVVRASWHLQRATCRLRQALQKCRGTARTGLWVLDILIDIYDIYVEKFLKLLNSYLFVLDPRSDMGKFHGDSIMTPMKWLEPTIAHQVQVGEVFRLQNGKASCLRCQQHREVVWSSIHFHSERWANKLLPSLTSWFTFCGCPLWDAFWCFRRIDWAAYSICVKPSCQFSFTCLDAKPPGQVTWHYLDQRQKVSVLLQHGGNLRQRAAMRASQWRTWRHTNYCIKI